jgi:hypothetical protein
MLSYGCYKRYKEVFSVAVFETDISFYESLSMVTKIDHVVCVAEKQPNYCFRHQRSVIRSWVYGALKTPSVYWIHLRIHTLNGLCVFEAMKGHPVSWRHLCIHTHMSCYGGALF